MDKHCTRMTSAFRAVHTGAAFGDNKQAFCLLSSSLAPVVKWISLLSSEQSFWVRILAGAL